ncbi:hypothetical protein NC652_005538 [Populus alba x Populus x berolinensis]|uniref:Uncharacterized protein n=1 Tax=Populus alba x Populus x berolinensis TaxID=444605 RepID=A0AAD6RDC9_9ROSI|nr:hypothetical protein NC652_005538 [Populus alba x Populus x berolinensis]KAJ7006207.1 hypothetical protein NC653_005534 [Populus alba x Populus x berolinensis]
MAMGLDSDRNPCPHFQVSVSGGLDLVPFVAGSRLIKSRKGCQAHPCFKMPDSGSPENHQIAFNQKFHLSSVVQT